MAVAIELSPGGIPGADDGNRQSKIKHGANHARDRLVLVEQHGIRREGLRALLELEPDLTVVGEAIDELEALSLIETSEPSLVITDIALPGHSGIELIAALRQAHPDTKILVLTANCSEDYIRAALNAGAHGYVLTDASRAELLQAIRTVLSGKTYLCARVTTQVVAGYLHPKAENLSVAIGRCVTQREWQVLIRVALGRSNKVIARELDLSVKTVEKHRANVMRKLTLSNTAAVTRFAIRYGMVSATDLEQDFPRTPSL